MTKGNIISSCFAGVCISRTNLILVVSSRPLASATANDMLRYSRKQTCAKALATVVASEMPSSVFEAFSLRQRAIAFAASSDFCSSSACVSFGWEDGDAQADNNSVKPLISTILRVDIGHPFLFDGFCKPNLQNITRIFKRKEALRRLRRLKAFLMEVSHIYVLESLGKNRFKRRKRRKQKIARLTSKNLHVGVNHG